MKKNLALSLLILATISLHAQTSAYQPILDRYANSKNFNGTVLVARGGKIQYASSRGLADRSFSVPVSAQTRFVICSITKTFTAALVLKWVELGKLDLHKPISAYFPEYRGNGRDSVTIHHLLTYSSGIPNCEGDQGLGVYQSPVPRDSFIAKYCSGPLQTKPGSAFNYDNGAYIILGKIIENVSGKSFSQNLDQFILKPLSMSNSGFISNRNLVKQLAASYVYNDSTGVFEHDPPYYLENYHASAAMYSTAEDLLKFDQALFNGTLLKRATVDLMLTPYPALWNVAYGFWVTDNKYGNLTCKAADRQGSIQGSNSSWLHLIRENISVIIFSNTNATNLNELREELVLATLKQPGTKAELKEK